METSLDIVCLNSRKEADAVRWYAMTATYRNEAKVQEQLSAAGIETFVAMTTETVVMDGRKIKRRHPAVSNLLFVHSCVSRIQEVKKTMPHLQYKVRSMDGRTEKIVVNDSDMKAFMRLAMALDGVEYQSPDTPEIVAGSRVRVIGGDFQGMEGIILKSSRSRNVRFAVVLKDAIAAVIKIPREEIELLG